MNYKLRDDELIRINKEAQKRNPGNNSGNVGYSEAALKKMKTGTYKKKVPSLKKSAEQNKTEQTKATTTNLRDKGYSDSTGNKQIDFDYVLKNDKVFGNGFTSLRMLDNDLEAKNPSLYKGIYGETDNEQDYYNRFGMSKDQVLSQYSQYKQNKEKEAAEKHPILTSLKEAASAPYRGIAGALGMASQTALPNSSISNTLNDDFIQREVKDTQRRRDYIQDSENLSDFKKDAANFAGTSADFLANTAVSGILGKGSVIADPVARVGTIIKPADWIYPSLMGTSAYGLSSQESKHALEKQGIDEDKALTYANTEGVISGIVNALTAGMGSKAGNLARSTGQVIPSMLKSAGRGALFGGEMQGVREIVNALVLGDQGSFNADMQNYLNQGLSEDEAGLRSFGKVLGRIGGSSALSGVIGGLSSLTSSGLQRIGGKGKTSTSGYNTYEQTPLLNEQNVTNTSAPVDNAITNLTNYVPSREISGMIPQQEVPQTVIPLPGTNGVIPMEQEGYFPKDLIKLPETLPTQEVYTDIDSALEAAKKFPRMSITVNDETMDKIKARRKTLKGLIETNEGFIKDKEKEIAGKKRVRKTERAYLENLKKEYNSYKKEEKALKRLALRKRETPEEMLKKSNYDEWKNLYDYHLKSNSAKSKLNTLVKFAGDTPEAKAAAKQIMQLWDYMLETSAFPENIEIKGDTQYNIRTMIQKPMEYLDKKAKELNLKPYSLSYDEWLNYKPAYMQEETPNEEPYNGNEYLEVPEDFGEPQEPEYKATNNEKFSDYEEDQPKTAWDIWMNAIDDASANGRKLNDIYMDPRRATPFNDYKVGDTVNYVFNNNGVRKTFKGIVKQTFGDRMIIDVPGVSPNIEVNNDRLEIVEPRTKEPANTVSASMPEAIQKLPSLTAKVETQNTEPTKTTNGDMAQDRALTPEEISVLQDVVDGKYDIPETGNEEPSNVAKNPVNNTLSQRSYTDLIPENPFYETDSYKGLEANNNEVMAKIANLEGNISQLREALPNEIIGEKPRAEWTANDLMESVAGNKPMQYTKDGQNIISAIDRLEKELGNLKTRADEILEGKSRIKNKARNEQLQNYNYSAPTPATQNDYPGFDITKATNGNIQKALDSGEAFIAEMSPLEYLQRVAYDIYDDATLENTIISAEGLSKLPEYVEAMQRGEKFPILDLTYSGKKGQEGRTRALAAYEAGIDKIPVAIVGEPNTVKAESINNNPTLTATIDEIPKMSNDNNGYWLRLLGDENFLKQEAKANNIDPALLKGYASANLGYDGIPTIRQNTPPPNNTVNGKVENGKTKTSQTYTNTGRRGGGWDEEQYNKYTDPSMYQYETIDEEESVNRANQMRINEGREGFKKRVLAKEKLSSIEIDGLMMEWRELTEEARALEEAGKDASVINKEAIKVFRKIQKQSTDHAQALQALAKWSRNTPEGMIMHAESMIRGKAKDERGTLEKATDKLLKREGKKFKFSDDFVMEAIKDAEEIQKLDPDSRLAEIKLAELGKKIARQMPSTFSEKVVSYLMDSMLGNFRTLIARNAGGNVGLNLAEQFLQRPLAAGIDSLLSIKTGERTQAGLSKEGLVDYTKGLIKGIKDEAEDFKLGLHTARSGENTIDRAISANRHVFKEGSLMDKADALVKHGLSIGDRPFYESVYNQTIGDYFRLRQKGVLNPDIMNLDQALFNELAETAARLNALGAVYQGDTTLSKALLKFKDAIGDLSKGMVGVDVLSQFSMPFVKTPANVIDTTISYSPLGFVRNAVKSRQEIHDDGGINQNRFANETARNIIGTGLFAGGAAAAANGLLSGGYSDDADEKQAQKDAGMQEYALDTNNKQRDIGWVPVLGTVLTGAAAAYDAYKNGDGSLGNNLAKGAYASGQKLFDQSMFQGMQRLFGTGESYDSDEGIIANMANVAKQGLSQGIPSLVRQTGQVIDKYQRDISNSNKGISFGPFDNYDINSLAKNLPFLREKVLAPKVDREGNLLEENQGRNVINKIAENMILPGKVTEINYTALDEEAKRLKDATTSSYGYMPKANRKAIDADENKATNQEWVDYQQYYNKTMNEAGNQLINSEDYKKLSADVQVEMLGNVYTAIKTAINSDFTNTEVSGASKLFKETGGGSAGANAVVSYYLDKNKADSLGLQVNKYRELEEEKPGSALTYSKNKKNLDAINEKYGTNFSMESYEKYGQSDLTKRAEAKPKLDALNEKYNANMTLDKYLELGQTGAENYLKNREAAEDNGFVSKSGQVQTTQYEKVIKAAGNQSDRMIKDIPALKNTNLEKSAYYTYANAINVDPSITVPSFTKTYNEINTDKSNAMTQKEILEYINKTQWSNDPEQDLAIATKIWKTYGNPGWKNKAGTQKKIKLGKGNKYVAYY